jgi:hypothetical protein
LKQKENGTQKQTEREEGGEKLQMKEENLPEAEADKISQKEKQGFIDDCTNKKSFDHIKSRKKRRVKTFGGAKQQKC